MNEMISNDPVGASSLFTGLAQADLHLFKRQVGNDRGVEVRLRQWY